MATATSYLAAAMCVAASLSFSHNANGQIPRVATYLYEGNGKLTLSFARSDCPAECHVAGLICSTDGLLTVYLADLPGQDIARWFRFDAEEPTFPTAELILDGGTTILNFSDLTFDDLNAGWWVGMSPTSYDWLPSLSQANSVVIQTPVARIELPATDEDRAVRAAFVEACLAM